MRPARAARPSRARESGASAGRSCLPRVPSARPLAASAARTLPDPPDAGPGDAVLPPGRSTRPGPCPHQSLDLAILRAASGAWRTTCLVCRSAGWPARNGRMRAGTCPLVGGCPWVMRPIEPDSQILVMSRPPWAPHDEAIRAGSTAASDRPGRPAGRVRGAPRGPAPGAGSDGGR